MSPQTHVAEHLSARLHRWQDAGLGRTLADFAGGQDPVAEVDGESRLLFSSSNYLGLSRHPAVVEAAVEATRRFGTGSGGSRLTTGSTTLHRELEEELADWLGYDDCVVFNSGFAANLAALTVLADDTVTIYSDERNHASIIDGCRAAKANGARLVIYPHRDLETLSGLLVQRETAHGLVVTDGVFSMDGTVAPVADLVDLAHRHGCSVLVDDAHGIGTLGDGRGCAAGGTGGAGTGRADVLIGTTSKALASDGGFICANHVTCELLRNQGRSFIYSTASSAPTVAASLAAVRLVRDDPRIVARLQENVRRLAGSLAGSPATPIIPVPVGDEQESMEVAGRLRRRGFHIPAIRYPTVPRGQAILRVTVMATHSVEQIDQLRDALAEYGLTFAAGPRPDVRA